jgi:hypothetical protein
MDTVYSKPININDFASLLKKMKFIQDIPKKIKSEII